MQCFKIRHRSENDQRRGEEVSSTFIASVDDSDCFRVSFHREPGRVLQSQFESLSERFEDFEICQVNTGGLQRIAATENSGEPIGEIYGNKIISEDQIVLIDDVRSGSLPEKSGRNHLHAVSQMYSFRRSTDKSEIGCIESPNKKGGLWPKSVVAGIVKALTAKEVTVWEGQMELAEVDFRLILAASLALHKD